MSRGNVIEFPSPKYVHFVAAPTALLGMGGLKKGLSGHPDGFLEFWVKRFLCKKTGKTISVHPAFSHVKKQYYLPFVIDCMCLLLEKLLSINAVSRQCGVPRQTLASWKNSFSGSHIEAKGICFSHHTGPPEQLSQWMLNYFRNHESADIYKGAVFGMVRLREDYGAALY